MQNEELDYAEVIRKGARIFLVPIVHYVNKQLQTKFGDKHLEKSNFIYANSDSSNRELRIKNDRIQWDLYNIITFICLNKKNQKTNTENETINFRDFLFPEIRDDHFARFETLRSLRNVISHETYDGVEWNVLISLNDAETYLNDMKYLLQSIPCDDENAINDIDKLLVKLVQFKKSQNQLTDENFKNKILKNEKQRSEYKDEEIDISTINELMSVKKSSRVNFKNKIIKCTILKFKDSHEERIMDEWCDPSGKITKKAETLIGKNVVTTVWKPKSFDPQKWFRNIYEVDKDQLNNNLNSDNDCIFPF